MTKRELKKQVLALPEQDRVELTRDLTGSLLPPLTADEQVELDRAWEAYQANPDDVVSAEDAHRSFQARLRK
ncbi:MAG: addiction module protein [Acidobacteria bacterium]|nr:addiction module protein [Acidobacteriota bacterium]